MATAVTLKESDGSEIYPVTDISLVNNGIHAVDIEATTPVPAVETASIADGAVTNDKIDWSTIPVSYVDCPTTSAPHTPTGTCKISKIGKIVNLQVNFVYSGTNVFDLARFGDVVIANIPSGYIPPFHVYGAALVKCSSSTLSSNQINQVHLWASSGGTVLLNNMGEGGLTGVNSVRGSITWFVP